MYTFLDKGNMNPENNLIAIQTYKEITRLYKTFLELIEDIQIDHTAMLSKLSEKYDPEVVKDVNYFTPEKYEQIRKRVLDSGNECARQTLNFLDFYDFSINKQKLDDAMNRRKVFKKVVTSSAVIVE